MLRTTRTASCSNLVPRSLTIEASILGDLPCWIMLATDEMEAGPLLRAIRAGVHDVVPRDGQRGEIAPILARLLNEAVADRGSRGRLTLLLGADRDACAMVATDMAVATAARGSTLLIDCTLPTSAAASYLDLRSEEHTSELQS